MENCVLIEPREFPSVGPLNTVGVGEGQRQLEIFLGLMLAYFHRRTFLWSHVTIGIGCIQEKQFYCSMHANLSYDVRTPNGLGRDTSGTSSQSEPCKNAKPSSVSHCTTHIRCCKDERARRLMCTPFM